MSGTSPFDKHREMLEQRALLEAQRQVVEENTPDLPPVIRTIQERNVANEHRQHLRHCLQVLERDTLGSPYTKKARATLRAEFDRLTEMIRAFERSGRHAPSGTDDLVEVLSKLPAQLISARLACGLSQHEVARRVGVSQGRLSSWEHSLFSQVTLAKLKRVAEAISCSAKTDV